VKGREGNKGRGGACFLGFDAKVIGRWWAVGGKAKKEDGVKGYGLRVNHKEMKAVNPSEYNCKK
jgi:hypothetical protein